MKPSFIHLLHREVDDLLGDPWLLSLVTWVPLLLAFTMWWIFSQGIATELPVGVVDLDKSRTSRALVRHFEASPSLKMDDTFLAVPQAISALKAGHIYSLVILPRGLEEQTLRGWPPRVTVFSNGQFLLTQKVINAAILQAQGTYATRVETVRNLASTTPVLDGAFSAALPVSSQTVPLFNAAKNYTRFLVSAIFPAIWQMVMGIGPILSLSAVHRKYTLPIWLGVTPVRALLAKMVFLTILFWLHGLFSLTVMYGGLGWPMHGDGSLLLVAQWMTAWTSTGAGFLIFLLTRDAARSLSIAVVIVASALAFMGVTFPASDMPLAARIWRSLIPICHYIEIQIGQANYGAPMEMAIPQLTALALLFVPGLMALAMAPRFAGPGRTLSAKAAA